MGGGGGCDSTTEHQLCKEFSQRGVRVVAEAHPPHTEPLYSGWEILQVLGARSLYEDASLEIVVSRLASKCARARVEVRISFKEEKASSCASPHDQGFFGAQKFP